MVVCRNPTDPREHGVFTNADCDPGSQVFIRWQVSANCNHFQEVLQDRGSRRNKLKESEKLPWSGTSLGFTCHTIKDRASLGVFVSRPFAAGHEIALANIVQGNFSALRYPWTGTVSSWLERERPDLRQEWTGHQEKKREARRFKRNIGLACVYRDGQFWNARPPCKDVEER